MKLSRQLPALQQLIGFIDQRRPALIKRLRADQNVIFILFGIVDHLRIPLMFAVIIPRSEQRLRQFLHLAVCSELCRAGVGRPHPVLITVVARIKEIQLSVRRDRRSRMRALIVIEGIRLQSDACIRPMHQILGDHMIPILQSVHRPPRCPLVKQMPFPFMIHKTIRIARQPCDRLHMEFLPVNGFRNALVQIRNLVRALQHPVTLLQCPFFHKFPPL